MKENWKKITTLFMIGQTISLFGSSLVAYAITWYVTLNSKSGIMMGISVVCGFLPTFLLSPFAGVWADRFDKKKLIMLADGFIALVTAYMFIMFRAGNESLLLIFALSIFRAIGTGIQTPCVNALIPQIVPAEKLEKVNGINSSIQAFTMLLAPMLSGFILSVSQITYVFSIDIITAAFAIVIMLVYIKIPKTGNEHLKRQNTYLQDMKRGLDYIHSKKYLNKFFIFYGVIYLLCTPVCFLAALQTTRSFGAAVWRLSVVEVAFSVGMIIGGVLITAIGGFKNRIHTVILASFLIATCTILLGVSPLIKPVFAIYVVFMIVVGAGMSLYNTPVTIMLQEKVDSEFQGRVFGVLTMISSSMMPFGMIIFGPIADKIKIEYLFIGTGALVLLETFMLITNKDIIEAGRPESCK